MKTPKFYIGPMTKNVIDAVIEFSNETNTSLGLIASRRQIEHDCSGYVGLNTHDFINYVRNKSSNILLCRDHSGQLQGSNSMSLYEDVKSLCQDAILKMDVIHIDPWKKYVNDFRGGLNESMNQILYINHINPNIQFEVGTEESIKPFSPLDLITLLSTLKYDLGPVFKQIKYAVIQSGTSLSGTQNTGNFSLSKLKEMTKICRDFGILSKEHNGDYLSNEDVKIRFDNGLNALNIAPEFGVLETKLLIKDINTDQLDKIYDICLKGKKWVKWVPKTYKPEEHRIDLIHICGHYHNAEIKKIVKKDDRMIIDKIKIRLQELNNIVNE